jgi:hypothetical protein
LIIRNSSGHANNSYKRYRTLNPTASNDSSVVPPAPHVPEPIPPVVEVQAKRKNRVKNDFSGALEGAFDHDMTPEDRLLAQQQRSGVMANRHRLVLPSDTHSWKWAGEVDKRKWYKISHMQYMMIKQEFPGAVGHENVDNNTFYYVSCSESSFLYGLLISGPLEYAVFIGGDYYYLVNGPWHSLFSFRYRQHLAAGHDEIKFELVDKLADNCVSIPSRSLNFTQSNFTFCVETPLADRNLWTIFGRKSIDVVVRIDPFFDVSKYLDMPGLSVSPEMRVSLYRYFLYGKSLPPNTKIVDSPFAVWRTDSVGCLIREETSNYVAPGRVGLGARENDPSVDDAIAELDRVPIRDRVREYFRNSTISHYLSVKRCALLISIVAACASILYAFIKLSSIYYGAEELQYSRKAHRGTTKKKNKRMRSQKATRRSGGKKRGRGGASASAEWYQALQTRYNVDTLEDFSDLIDEFADINGDWDDGYGEYVFNNPHDHSEYADMINFLQEGLGSVMQSYKVPVYKETSPDTAGYSLKEKEMIPVAEAETQKPPECNAIPTPINHASPRYIGVYASTCGHFVFTNDADNNLVVLMNKHVWDQLYAHKSNVIVGSRFVTRVVNGEKLSCNESVNFRLAPEHIRVSSDFAVIPVVKHMGACTNKMRYTAVLDDFVTVAYPGAPATTDARVKGGKLLLSTLTFPGYCGSPAYTHTSRDSVGQICGLHHSYDHTNAKAQVLLFTEKDLDVLKLRRKRTELQGVMRDTLIHIPDVFKPDLAFFQSRDRFGKVKATTHFPILSHVTPPKAVYASSFHALPFDTKLPKSPYRPARMDYSSCMAAYTKYGNQKYFESTAACFREFAATYLGDVSLGGDTYTDVVNSFNEEFGGVAAFLEKPLSYEEVCTFLLENMNGESRGPTSCGYGFDVKRDKLLDVHEDAVKSVYYAEDFDFTPVITGQAKDEIRHKDKDTRGISIFQIQIYIIAIKYLGGLYRFFKRYTTNTSIAFGADPTAHYWTAAFDHLDRDEPVACCDLSKQDSRFNHIFTRFMITWLQSLSPKAHHEAIDWIFSTGYLNKMYVLPGGELTTFENGEASGFPLTILMNSFYTYFLLVLSYKSHWHKHGCSCKIRVLVCGDDTVHQMCKDAKEDYAEICEFFNHAITGEVVPFEQIDFISNKFVVQPDIIIPYYGNVPKACGSLRWYNNNLTDYYHKLCAFRNLLFFAPEGTDSYKLKLAVNRLIQFVTDKCHVPYDNCFLSADAIRRTRIGYQCFPMGGLILNMKAHKPDKAKHVNLDRRVANVERSLSNFKSEQQAKMKKLAETGNAFSDKDMALVKKFCTDISLAERPFKFPRGIPAYTRSMAFGGESDLPNEKSFNKVTFNPGDPDNAISISKYLPEDTYSTYFQRFKLDATGLSNVDTYYLALPMRVGSPIGRETVPPTVVKSTPTDAVVLADGSIMVGYRAFYPEASIASGGTIWWNNEFGEYITAPEFVIWDEITNATLYSFPLPYGGGSQTIPSGILNKELSFQVRSTSSSPWNCTYLFRFSQCPMSIKRSADQPLVEYQSIWDYTRATGASDYDDASNQRGINAASLFLHSVETAYSTGRIYYGLVANHVFAETAAPSDLYDFMGSKLFNKQVNNLNDGAFVTWVPTRRQDLFMVDRRETVDTNAIVMVWQNNSVDMATNSLTIDPRVVYEYNTSEQLVMPTIAPGSLLGLASAYFTYTLQLRAFLQENPKHLRNIARHVGNFVKNPIVRDVVKKAIPVLMAAGAAL